MACAVGSGNEVLVILLAEPVEIATDNMLRTIKNEMIRKDPSDMVLSRQHCRLYPAGIVKTVGKVLVAQLKL